MPIIAFPYIDPIAVSVGPIKIYWYALAYVFGIILAGFYAKRVACKLKLDLTPKQIENFISPAIIGIIIGGRAGYVLFYDPLKYLSDPMEILRTYNGGMSFHGGIFGLLIALYFYCRKNKIKILHFTDLLAVVCPIGLFLGRIANFINAELYGRVTNVPWGMIFPDSDGNIRHPSQIYEALFEGVLLFIFINYISFRFNTFNKIGFNTGISLIFYSTSRIIIEIFREPDFNLSIFAGAVTMGQILSFPMLLIGIYLLTPKLRAQN